MSLARIRRSLVSALVATVSVATGPSCDDSSLLRSPGDGGPAIVAKARIATFAGRNGPTGAFADGSADVARFDMPEGVALDPKRGALYVADSANHAVRRVDLATGAVTTIAGVGAVRGRADTKDDGGERRAALFDTPRSLAMSPEGDAIYVTDTGNYAIRRVDLESLRVTTPFGTLGEAGSTDGRGADARFGLRGLGNPWTGGIAIDGRDPSRPTMYVADSANHTLRSIDLSTSEVRTVAGRIGSTGYADGRGATARFNKPAGIAVGPSSEVYLTDANSLVVRRFDPATGEVTTVAGKAPGDPSHFCELLSAVLPPECGATDAPRGADARFRFPYGMAPDGSTGLFIVDSHSNVVRRLEVTTTAVTTVAGVEREILDDIPNQSEETTATSPGGFWHPTHVAFLPPRTLFVADRGANCIRRVELDSR
ncbi:MAG: hypothetical protein JST00_09200 [Deltaproteobacteria bacterium]|nr:hypothetical protein [Deltaproteobacteria bacterium]